MHAPFEGPPSPLHMKDVETIHWEQYGFNFGSWDEKKVWAIELPVTKMPVSDFDWHLDVPYWDSIDGKKFSVTPRDVLTRKSGTEKEQERVKNINTNYPIDVLFHEGKWFILDGVHRLIRILQEGQGSISVRVFPNERFHEIR